MKERLKIGLFIDTFFPMVDGVVMVVDNYAKRLSKFCDVTVFTIKPHGDCDRKFDYKVVQCKSSKLFNVDYEVPMPRFDSNFKKALKNSNLDIVHIHSPFGVGAMGVRYAKKHNIPVVATLHSQYKQDFYRSTKSKILTNIMIDNIINVFNKCDKCYAVNDRIAEIFYGYGANHMPLVQRNGTDMLPVENKEEAIKMVNEKYQIDDDTTVFLFVGRINALKNIFFILNALENLKHKDFKMIYVGDGQDFDELKKRVSKSTIADKVILTGKIMDRQLLEAIYLRAKLFLFPSNYDASSLVQIEAASQGTPTVFIQGSATSATVTDNVNGFIARPTEEKFAEKIDEILDDEQLYKKVQEGAVRDLYVTWDDCVKEMYGKYLQAIEDKKLKLNNRLNKKDKKKK